MKKILALALAAVMTVGTMMFPAAAATEKTTINLWAFTDEVPGMMTKFLEAHPELNEKVRHQHHHHRHHRWRLPARTGCRSGKRRG